MPVPPLANPALFNGAHFLALEIRLDDALAMPDGAASRPGLRTFEQIKIKIMSKIHPPQWLCYGGRVKIKSWNSPMPV